MRGILFVLAALSSGCATYINDTAPTKTRDAVYAVGTQQGFFEFDSRVWRCLTKGPEVKGCEPVEVETTVAVDFR